jgi:four helix bundle protein
MQEFRDLKVWQRAHQLVLRLYETTGKFPDEERFGLSSQLRRAAVSIPANIAEGSRRGSDADFGRFLHISIGSASEVDYLLLLARDLDYIRADEYASLHSEVQEVGRMLNGLLARVRAASSSAAASY